MWNMHAYMYLPLYIYVDVNLYVYVYVFAYVYVYVYVHTRPMPGVCPRCMRRSCAQAVFAHDASRTWQKGNAPHAQWSQDHAYDFTRQAHQFRKKLIAFVAFAATPTLAIQFWPFNFGNIATCTRAFNFRVGSRIEIHTIYTYVYIYNYMSEKLSEIVSHLCKHLCQHHNELGLFERPLWPTNAFHVSWKSSWLVVSTPLKNMKVSWDHYSQYMEKYKIFQTTNQPWCRLVPQFWRFNRMCPGKIHNLTA